MRRAAGLVALLLLVLAPTGRAASSAGAATSVVPAAPAITTQDRWYRLDLLGSRVGWAHEESGPAVVDGRTLARSRVETHTELARAVGGATERLVVDVREEWLETAAGELVRVSSTQDQGAGGVTTVTAEPGRGALAVRIAAPAGERRLEVPWSGDVLSPAAVERRIAALVASGGRELTYRTFSLEALQVVTVRLQVVGEVPEGLRVDQEMSALDTVSHEVRDRRGELVRQELGPLVLTRTTRDEALAPLVASLAPFRALTVGIVGTAPPARDARLARYGLVPRAGAASPPTLAELFPPDARQSVARDGGREVLTVRAGAGAPRREPAPDASFLAPSSLVESDDPGLVALARETAGSGKPDDRARRLERWVHEHVAYRGSGIGFASALETLRTRDGDCTEHAVLLAALLRAAAIPSRVVVGLVRAPGDGGREAFLPHAWVEAWMGEGWLPLDAAIWGPEVDATHLAMAKTAAGDSGSLLEITAPLLRGLGRFDLEPLGPPGPR